MLVIDFQCQVWTLCSSVCQCYGQLSSAKYELPATQGSRTDLSQDEKFLLGNCWLTEMEENWS